MNEKPVVMISSTVKDLPDYRSMVMDACLRADTIPKMMEQLAALDSSAIEVSMAMVDESKIYIGIFAHKYGYIPAILGLRINKYDLFQCGHANLFARDNKFINSVH